MSTTASRAVAAERGEPAGHASGHSGDSLRDELLAAVAADAEPPELLEDKLQRPHLEFPVLRRPRVTNLLNEAGHRRVTLVTGPAGAGKTVAAALWAASQPARCPVAWLTVDPADGDPARLRRYLTAALSRAGLLRAEAGDGTAEAEAAGAVAGPGRGPGPDTGRVDGGAGSDAGPAGAGEVDTGAGSAGSAGQGVSAGAAARQAAAGGGTQDRRLAQQIAASIRQRDRRAVMIIDDLQALAGSPALASLDELLRHLPAGLGVILVARSVPELGLARLRVAGELADVGSAELACTAEEARDYFDLLDSPLSAAARERAFRHSEGWLAGLRLTGLAAAAYPEPGDQTAADADAVASKTVAGAQSLAAGYLQDEMLDALAPEQRAFLLRTCLTETVPVGLAQELTGGAAAGTLEQLSKDHGLVQATGPDQGEYRYHPMLAEALRAAVRRELPDEVPDLERRVSGWHAARGEVTEAVRAAATVGDWDLGARALRAAGPPVALSPAAAELEGVLAGFPADQLAADPALAAALAAARLWQGDSDGALPHLEWAELALSEQHAAGHDSLALWTTALRVLYSASVGETGGGRLRREWALAREAHENPTGVPAHQALGVLWLALGFAALRDVDLPQARSALLHAGSQLSAAGLLSLRERARSWEAVASALHGDLAAATRIAATVSEGPCGADGDLAPVLALAAAQVSLARDELETAAGQLDEADLAVPAQRPAGEPSIGVVSGLLRARLAMADGNLAGARGLVRWLTELVAGSSRLAVAAAGQPPQAAGEGGGLTGAAQAVAALDAEISLAAGADGRAQATLAAAGLTESDQPVRPVVAICRARLLVAGEDDKGALRQLEPLLAEANAGGTLLERIEALLTAAIAHRRLSQPADAAALLEEALALAEPDDASGPFVLAGSAARSALTVLIPPSSRCAAFATRILDRFDGRQQRPGPVQPGSPLTESELAVLRFLPSHMTNQEIAQALFLSINTIKTHLSSVYRKLGVVNRRQAIAQGRKLDLLLAGQLRSLAGCGPPFRSALSRPGAP